MTIRVYYDGILTFSKSFKSSDEIIKISKKLLTDALNKPGKPINFSMEVNVIDNCCFFHFNNNASKSH